VHSAVAVDSSGTQEGERPPLEAGTRGPERQQLKRTQCVLLRTVDCELGKAI
jgi:hypothetical protein